MKIALSAREKRILGVVLALAGLIGWLYASYLIKPLGHELKIVDQQLAQAQERLRMLEISTSNEAVAQEQHQRLEESVNLLQNRLPPEETLPAVIARLSDLATQTDVKIQSIFPQRPASAKGKAAEKEVNPQPMIYKEVIIQIDALAGFHQLGTFLSYVEKNNEPMQVHSLQILSPPKGGRLLEIKLLLEAYFANTGSVPITSPKGPPQAAAQPNKLNAL